jgi:hypothetical protein
MQHRKVISLVYLAAIGTLLACIFYFGWSLTWAVFVPEPLSPSFADLRVIQAAVTSASQGLNPQISNPGTSVLNYPLIWVKIGEVLHFQNESRFIWICSLEVLCFVGFCVYLLHCFPSFGLLASLLSSATLFAIERGNSDLIIYCLVLLFVPIISKKLSPIPILVATGLKIYPVFALGALLIKRQFCLFFASVIIALGIFFYLLDELALIWSGTLRGYYTSYGFPSLAVYFFQRNWPAWIFVGLVTVLCPPLIFVTGFFLRKMGGLSRYERHGFAFNLFFVGASIYVGTFIFSTNFDYRLIFLSFCIPFLETRRFPLGGLLVISVVAAMNEFIIIAMLGWVWLAVSWSLKIGIFIVLSAYLAVVLVDVFEGELRQLMAYRSPRKVRRPAQLK